MADGSSCRDCGGASFGYEICARCVGRRLAADRIRDVVEELAPEGQYEPGGREYRIGSNRGLAIVIGGPKSGLWYDHTSGEGGDLLAWVAHRRGGTLGEALRWARARLGQPEPHRRPRPVTEHKPADETENRDRAEQIWRQAVPLCRGDPVCRYLAGRAIDLERLAGANDGKLPGSLRFHPRLWNKEAQRRYPAMVAAIVDREGQFAAVHRTWVKEGEDGRVTKAPVKDPKLTLGGYSFGYGKGCVRLWRPKWSQATDEDTLALSEGIEDGLTIAQAQPLWRVAAGVSGGALKTTWVPEVFSEVVLIRQNDAPGSKAARAFDQVRARFRREGRTVRLLTPPHEVKDVNDVAVRFSSLAP